MMVNLPTDPRFKNLTGKVFGRLTVLKYAGRVGGAMIWLVSCECGKTKTIAANRLRSGTKSCGCLHSEVMKKRNTTHGKRRYPEYSVWAGMIKRCESKNEKCYPDYGGRGITVCERWRNSFQSFFDDMGPRPSPKHEIDRIDTNGNYEPSNCRWIIRLANSRNKRSNHLLELQGEVHCITEWEDILGLKRGTIDGRIRNGWSAERAITTPVRKIKNANS